MKTSISFFLSVLLSVLILLLSICDFLQVSSPRSIEPLTTVSNFDPTLEVSRQIGLANVYTISLSETKSSDQSIIGDAIKVAMNQAPEGWELLSKSLFEIYESFVGSNQANMCDCL